MAVFKRNWIPGYQKDGCRVKRLDGDEKRRRRRRHSSSNRTHLRGSWYRDSRLDTKTSFLFQVFQVQHWPIIKYFVKNDHQSSYNYCSPFYHFTYINHFIYFVGSPIIIIFFNGLRGYIKKKIRP